jgi:hypothetical protein
VEIGAKLFARAQAYMIRLSS